MKRFRFKLEVVLVERKRVEDARLREWILAQHVLKGMIDELHGLRDRLLLAFEESTAMAAAPDASVGLLSTMEAFIKGTKIRIQWKEREIERGRKLTERKRLEYVEASRKRKVLETLRDRREAEHKAAARKQERKELDDLYIMNGAVSRRASAEDEL